MRHPLSRLIPAGPRQAIPSPGRTGLASLALVSLALAAGCATRPSLAPVPAMPADVAPAAAVVSCQGLEGFAIPAEAIGLPTRGARVQSVAVVDAGGTGAKTFGGYCRLVVEIAPVDQAAPPIRVQLSLPDQWNRRSLMLGGGGYNGILPNTAGNVAAGPVDRPDPIGRGYAVFGSDSGHDLASDPANPGSFGLNDEALRNFAGDALKKTYDTARAIIRHRYGASPLRNYFAGGSTGGREALAMVQKWPADIDGAIVLYPAYSAASLNLQFGRMTRALAAPGAYPNLAKRKALLDAAMAACDGLDGVVDGVVSHQAQCNARFDPATAMLGDRPLRCEGGADTGDQCLSDAQIAAMKVINTPIQIGYPLANGERHYPGFNVWGSDFGRPGDSPVQAVVNRLGLNVQAPAHPMPLFGTGPTAVTAYGSGFWDQWVRFFVTRDPKANALELDPQQPGPWQQRISELTGLQDHNQTDLSPFAKRGGKVLMAHGTADQLVSTRATAEYFERIQGRMGAGRVHGFLRYYEIPGYGHAASTQFGAAWDSLTALERWSERGEAPAAQIVVDATAVPGRTRPLCEYPTWPRYSGTGDVNQAASFRCVKD